MSKLFGYLRNAKLTVALIIALLVLQAYCDLALPQYMSNIVDVGISQGGIDSPVPAEIRASTLNGLYLLMTDDEVKTVEASYTLADSGHFTLAAENREALDALAEIFPLPMTILMQASGDNAQETGEAAEGMAATRQAPAPEDIAMYEQLMQNGIITADMRLDMDAFREAAASGLKTDEMVLFLRGALLKMLGDMDVSILTQAAIAFVKAEYEALGMNMESLQTGYLLRTGGIMLGITALMAVSAILVGYLAARTAAKIGMDLRGKVFRKVVSFSQGDMEKFSSASLITRSTNDVQMVQQITVMLLRMVVYAPIVGIGGVIKVINTNTGMGWIICVAVALLLVLVGLLLLVAMPKFQQMPKMIDRVNLVAREILSGLQVIRAFSREEHENGRFDEVNKSLMNLQLFTNRVMTFMMPLMMLIMNGITLAIVWFGAQGINVGNLQLGSMLAFISYTMQIVSSFLMLSMISVFLPRAAVSAGRIDEVLKTEPSIQDKTQVLDDSRTFQGIVAFDHVSFRYPDAEQDVLENISFTAKPGETTAIIGSTGSGKSTLLNLIPRFFDVTEGRVTLDGVDIRDLSQHKLRSVLGYVPQKGVLFTGDIESNIKYGGEDITDADMVHAAEIAQAVGFINEKPERYHDSIAQGGTNVSGGQKQRLSIARAIAKRPKVLLFDDSFSALDFKTDVTLRRALRENIREATVVIVAQRISTVLHADQILVLEEGRMVGLGTHEELMETCRVYQDIARSQLSETELRGGALA